MLLLLVLRQKNATLMRYYHVVVVDDVHEAKSTPMGGTFLIRLAGDDVNLHQKHHFLSIIPFSIHCCWEL